jgi:prepilin signal peptidase PulO-like enzyme (type II secretory pathway)
MEIAWIITASTLLTCFSSFIMCSIENGISLNARSKCKSCGKELSWYELIPIVSYLIQLGKCRTCKNKIPARLFFAECLGLATGIFIFTVKWPMICLVILLWLSSLFDLEKGEVPNILTIGMFGVAVAINLVYSQWMQLFSEIGIFVVMYLYYQIRANSIGGADIWAISAVFGTAVYTEVTMILLTASITALLTILFLGKRDRGSAVSYNEYGKTGIRFLPFLLIGVIIGVPVSHIVFVI